MKITRDNCEAYLRHAARKIVNAGVTDAATLLAVPALRKMLMQAIGLWAMHIACQQHVVVEIGREVGMDNGQLTSDFVSYAFRRGERKPYPLLNSLLAAICKDGPDAIAPYLMTAARMRALDLSRRHEVRRERMGELRGFNQDDEYGAIDPGEGKDVTEDLEKAVLRRNAMERLFAHMGEKFLSDVVILSDAVGMKREVAAQLMFAGKQAELVTTIIQRLNRWLHDDYTDALSLLVEQAREYKLPAEYKSDYEKLLACLYRQSSGAARARLEKRCEGDSLWRDCEV